MVAPKLYLKYIQNEMKMGFVIEQKIVGEEVRLG